MVRARVYFEDEQSPKDSPIARSTPKVPKQGATQSFSNNYVEYIVFISLILDLLAFTMILPLFPSLLEYYEKNDSSGLYSYLNTKVKHLQHVIGIPEVFNNVLFGGLLGSMFSFLQFVASPIIGAFSDVYGRRPVILICLCGIASSHFLWSRAHTFGLFVLARIIGGISKGNISLSMAIITDVSTPETRTRGMALTGIAFSVGFMIGPLIGVVYTQFAHPREEGWFANAALLAFTLVITDILFVFLIFRETLPKWKREKSVATSVRHALGYINVIDLFSFAPVQGLSKKEKQEVGTLGIVYFIYLFLYSGLEFTLTFLTHYKFKYTSMKQGWMFFGIGLTMAIFQGGWVRRIPKELVQQRVLFGLVLIMPAFLCVGLAESAILLYTGLFLFSVSTAIVVPCMTSIASKYGSSSQKGVVLGIFRSLGALARALGPIFASIAYWVVGATITYCAGALLLLIPWYLMKTSPKMKI